MSEDFVFEGFEPANTTPVPDILFDVLLKELSGAELKVLLYIIRRTKGFKKDTDAISLTQFQKGIKTREGKQLDRGCGIGDRQTIVNALISLEKKRCIISEKKKTDRGDNAPTLYRIYFAQVVVGNSNHGSVTNPTTVVGKPNHGSRENPTTPGGESQPPVVGKPNPQETVIQLDSKQETVIHNDMSLDISVTCADETFDSENTVSDGGNESSSTQETTTPHQDGDSKPLSEQIETAIQEIDEMLPAQNGTPKNESGQQIGALPPNQEETSPASYSPNVTTNKRPRKPRVSKSSVSLTDTTPIPPPAKPSEDQLWTPLTCIMLADYYRGSVLEESNRSGSKYDKAVKASIKLVNQQHKTYQEVDQVFCYMKGLDKDMPGGVWDEWWEGKDVDLWNVGDHCGAKLVEIERKKKGKSKLSNSNSSQRNNNPPVQQEPTPEKAASIAAAEAVMARFKQKQAI